MAVNLTRRELLTTFLGLPLALSACQHSQPLPPPDGEIIGASASIGHQIRDGLTLKPASDNWKSVDTIIVGGGAAGLSAAWRLQKAGIKDFLLLELEPAPGGTARSGRNSLIAYPWGAHYIPAPLQDNPGLIMLFEEMGLLEGTNTKGNPIVAEQFLCRDPQERIFYRGRWYEGLYLYAGASPTDLAQFKAFQHEIDRWVAWRDSKGRRAFIIPTAKASDDVEVTDLDKISMAQWLTQHGWDSPRLRWLVDYGCRDDYGARLEDTSAWAGIFYFASRVAQAGKSSQPLVTWPEGNGHLVNYLYDQVKEQVKLGWAVTDINPTDNGIEVIVWDTKANQAMGLRAKQVICATPQFLARYLVRPYRESPPAYISQFEYGTWMVANLTLKDRPILRSLRTNFPLAWDNVLYESPALGYVVATHQRGLDYGPTVFTYYYPLLDTDPQVARKRLLSTDWASWADVALTDLSVPHPDIRALTSRLDVMRWGHAMIRPKPGFIWSGARQQAAQPYRGIHFAQVDLSGVAIFEEAFYHGVRAAEAVLTSFNIATKSFL